MTALPGRFAFWFLGLLPLACDAFSGPEEPGMPVAPFEPPPRFCPATTFPDVTSQSAFVGPLFAWITEEERILIETGGPILSGVFVRADATVNLPRKVLDLIAVGAVAPNVSRRELPRSLAGQPAVGRSFWPLAFAAAKESTSHDQLLAIWLRNDAWLATYLPEPSLGYPVVDASGTDIASASATPGRIAGMYLERFDTCLRAGYPERGFVVFREEAIERYRTGEEVHRHSSEELVRLEALLREVRASSGQDLSFAFDGATCTDPLSAALQSGVLCSESTYVRALSWVAPKYLPTIPALSALIDELGVTPVGSPSGSLDGGDRTSPDELAAWAAVWPGPWRSEAPGEGLGGAGGLGGLGGY